VSYFEDLTPYRYIRSDEDAVNVGWLSAGHPFPVGQADQAEVAEVLRLVRDEPVQRTRGWHRCDLCERPDLPDRTSAAPVEMDLDGTPVYLGDCEIRVRDTSAVVYAAPSLLAHYMAIHDYVPAGLPAYAAPGQIVQIACTFQATAIGQVRIAGVGASRMSTVLARATSDEPRRRPGRSGRRYRPANTGPAA